MAQSRSIKAIILASGQSLTTLVGLVSAVVLTRLFTQDDYATYRQTLLAYTFAAPFVILGLDRALFYFLPNEKRRTRGVLVENLLLLAVGGLGLTLFLLAGGNHLLAGRFNNPALVTALLLLAPYPLFMVPTTTLSACLLARDRTAQVAAYNVSSRLIMLLAVVLPCLFFPQPTVAIVGMVAGAGIAAMIAMTLMFRACDSGDWRPTFGGMRSQIAFSVPLGLSTLVGTVSRGLDQVFVAAMCPAATFAVFVNGAMEIPLVGIITGSVTSVLIVDYAKLYKEGRLDEIVRLIHRAMVKCALILIPVMAFLLCMAPELMRLLFGARYEGSAVPFRIYLLLLPIRTLTFGAIFMATGNSRYILGQAIIPLVGKLLLTSYAISYFGPSGAAMTTVLIAYCATIPYSLVYLCRILNERALRLFPWISLLKIGLASFAPTLVILLMKNLLPWPDSVCLATASAVYGLMILAMLKWLGLADVGMMLANIRSRLAQRFA